MKRNGLALIAVIVMIVLFSSIILAVVLSATMSIRRANYYKDKLIALEIAENGIQKWLNKINYEKYDSGYYPWGEDVSSIQQETTIEFYVQGRKGKCTLKIDPDNTGEDTKILAIGNYRGRQVKLSFELRSDTELKRGDKLNDGTTNETQGIPEAFNKHVVYSGTVNIGSSVSGKGNINATTINGTNTNFTKTISSNIQIPVLNPSYKPEDPINLKPTPTWNKRFKDADGSLPYEGASPHAQYLPAGVSYNVVNGIETYTISSGSISETWIFEKADSTSELQVKIEGNTVLNSGCIIKAGKDGSPSPTENADIIVDFSGSNNPNISGRLIAERDIKIENVGVSSPNPIGTEGNVTLWAGEDITITYNNTGPQIRGDIVGINSVKISGTQTKNINGCIISRSEITISGGSLNINTQNSQRKASIYLFNDNNATLTLNIYSPITLTIGEKQVSGIMVYFDNVSVGGTNKISNITISNNINVSNSSKKFLLFNQSEVSNTFDISGNISGSIYSVFFKDANQTINQTININGNITGSIITNGIVNLNGGSLNYNSSNYKGPFVDTKEVYKYFIGGRRKYLPVPGSWRIEW